MQRKDVGDPSENLSTLYFCLKMLWRGEKRDFRFCAVPSCIAIANRRPAVVANLQAQRQALHGLSIVILAPRVHTSFAVCVM